MRTAGSAGSVEGSAGPEAERRAAATGGGGRCRHGLGVGVGCGAGVGVGTGVGIGVGAGVAVGVGNGTAGSATGDAVGDGSATGVAVGRGYRGRGGRGGDGRARGHASGRGDAIRSLPLDPPEAQGRGAEHQQRRDQEGPVAAGRPPRRRALGGGAARGRGRARAVRLRPLSHGLLLGGRELGEVGQVLRAPLRRALQATHDRARELARQVGRDVRQWGRQLAARAADEHLPGDRARRVDVGRRRGRPPFDALRSRIAGLRRAALGAREVAPQVARDLDPGGIERGEELAPVVDRVQGLAQPLDDAQPLGERVILPDPGIELHDARGG